MECPVCMEEFNNTDRLQTNCVRCKEWICSRCFLKVVRVCDQMCHAKYVCPICKMEINLSMEFLNIVMSKMVGVYEFELTGFGNMGIAFKIYKDKNTGKLQWKRKTIILVRN